MKQRTIDKRKISKECWSLDYHFLNWLRLRLPVYLKDASKIVDLEYHKFEYKGENRTHKSLIEEMIKLLKEVDGMDAWDEGYCEKVNDILDIWKLVFFAMWW